MAVAACNRKLRCSVVWIIGLVVICLMTSHTGIGCINVISVMAGIAVLGNGQMITG